MNINSLIPMQTLSGLTREVRTRIAAQLPDVSVDAGGVGDALAWSLLFAHWPELLPATPIDRESAFYNRYYWFKRFAMLKQEQDGFDAGLEQNVFQLLEEADFDLDWDLIQQLDNKAVEQ